MGRVRIETKYVVEDGTYATGMELKNGIVVPLERKVGIYTKLSGRITNESRFSGMQKREYGEEHGDRGRQINTYMSRIANAVSSPDAETKYTGNIVKLRSKSYGPTEAGMGTGLPYGVYQRMVIDNQPVGDWYPVGVSALKPGYNLNSYSTWIGDYTKSNNNNSSG